MTTSSQTPSAALAVLPLHEAPQTTVFVDRDGDEWIHAGENEGGELRLVCPEPVNPDDQSDTGEGEPFPWTLRTVEAFFGPLTAVAR